MGGNFQSAGKRQRERKKQVERQQKLVRQQERNTLRREARKAREDMAAFIAAGGVMPEEPPPEGAELLPQEGEFAPDSQEAALFSEADAPPPAEDSSASEIPPEDVPPTEEAPESPAS